VDDFPLDLRQLAAALGGEASGGQVLAPGPGHSRDDRSLAVKIDASAPDGFLVHSFANDDPMACKAYVRDKLGLPAFKANGSGRHSAEDVAKLMREAVLSQKQPRKPKGKLSETYPYTDADGTLLYQVLRYVPKGFAQRRPDGNGGWIWSLGDRRVLYRWPELLKYPDATVFVTEGEKDANNVAALGHCATTVAHGRWTDGCVAALRGRHVLILEDADESGRTKALNAATLLYGIATTIRIVRLPGLADGGDVSDWLTTGHNGEELVDICMAAPLWEPSSSTSDTRDEDAENHDDSGNSTDRSLSLPFISMADWDDTPTPPREWAVRDRIPLRQPTLFSGEGAVGKSIIELQLCAAHVLGRDWLDTMPEFGPAMYLGAEDEADELRRRFTDIAAHYQAKFADLIAGGLHLLSFAGEDMLLGAPDRRGRIIPTKLFDRLLEAARDIRPKHIGLDTSADVFGGSEIDRAQVRQFVAMLRKLAIAANGAVVLLSHPSLTGMNSGTGLSGSTGWHNSVRARMYLKSPKAKEDEQPDTDLRELEFKKNNYGPLAARVVLRFRNGLFLPDPGLSTLDQLAKEQRIDDVFLNILRKMIEQKRPIGPSKYSPNYAPSRIAEHPDGKEFSVKDYAASMERLLNANHIHVATFGSPSKKREHLALGPAA
jgi:RecA-family ATPase